MNSNEGVYHFLIFPTVKNFSLLVDQLQPSSYLISFNFVWKDKKIAENKKIVIQIELMRHAEFLAYFGSL